MNPIWNETLEVRDVELCFLPADLAHSPPSVVIELFDHDRIGKGDFIGQAMVLPYVTLKEQRYIRPKLAWNSIYRGATQGGEILAACELLQVRESQEPPLLTQRLVNANTEYVFEIPKEIRPA